MKFNKIHFVISISFGITVVQTIAQEEHIRNGSFEQGTPLPQDYSGSGKKDYFNCNDWEGRYHWDKDYSLHSPDWFAEESFIHRNIHAHTGNSYIGMLRYELMQQELKTIKYDNNFEPGKAYFLSMYIQLADEVPMPGFGSINWDNTQLNVYLAKEKIKYKEEKNENHSCRTDYVQHYTGILQPLQEIKTIHSFPINATTYPVGGWHKISTLFIAPDGGINPYDWFAVELVQTNYQDLGTSQQCKGAYILIDDVSITDYCLYPCAPSLPNVTVYQSANAVEPNCRMATFIIGNALGYEFSVVNDWGGFYYNCTEFNPLGLNDTYITAQNSNYTNAWFVSWNGQDNDGDVVQVDAYPYILTVWNCNGKITQSGTITNIGACSETLVSCKNNSLFCCNVITTPPDCGECKTDLVLENPPPNFATYEASNSITAKTNFVIESGSTVILTAGNKITGQAGFHAKPGSYAHAYIGFCKTDGPNKMSPKDAYANNLVDTPVVAIDKKAEKKQSITFTQYQNKLLQNNPNPVKTTTDIIYSIKEAGTVSITLSNIYGQKLALLVNAVKQEAGAYKITMDAGKLSHGIYFYTIEARSESGDLYKETKRMGVVK